MRQFNEYFLNEIAKLPPDIAALAHKYPREMMSVIYAWDEEPFPEGYIPHNIEIYYALPGEVNVRIVDGVLRKYNVPEFEGNPHYVSVFLDGDVAYIEIEGQEVLNKLGGATLPQVTIDPSTLIEMLTGSKS
ncbi:hypothetical protein [Anabaena sp. UHCC 0399]|uniref:hypothetical protein n=1 Tax=Anabaena sp. UHCC 0399 TaxID=3110238 RepID=UPI002B217C72|nr:hypothetical protein [Anabaena sp. UHCC 0399]MEA5566643.1 hypothetical protein [Anabaena sp. UHCC 0399]